MKIVARILEAIGLLLLAGVGAEIWWYREGIVVSKFLLAQTGLTLALAVVCLMARKLSPVLRFNLFLLFLLLPVGAWTADLTVQALSLDEGAERGGEAADRRTALEVVADLRGANPGVVVVPSVVPRSLYRFENGGFASALGGDGLIPLGGVSGALTVLCNETGFWKTYRSDERGFNNPGPWTSGGILVVGDSFAHGACLAEEETIVGRLRGLGHPLVNLGMSSNGPLHELAALREYLPTVRPKLVLWFYYEGNDVTTDLPSDLHSPLFRRYLDEAQFSQNLASRQEEIDARLTSWLNAKTSAPDFVVARPVSRVGRVRIADVLLLRTLRNALNLGFGPPTSAFETFERVVVEAKRASESAGAEFLVVGLPAERRFVNAAGRLTADITHDRVQAILARNKIGLIDAAPLFAADSDPRSLFAGHYTPKGARIVADLVAGQAVSPALLRGTSGR